MALALSGLALALALPACGSQSSAAPEPSTAKTIKSAGAKPAPTGKPTATSASCASHLNGFVDQLEHLRRSLVIGVSYEQYVSELATVRKSYEQVPVGELGLACVIGVAGSAERSFDGYLGAANTWGECVSEAGCETAALEPKLQRKWQAAAKQLAEARRVIVR